MAERLMPHVPQPSCHRCGSLLGDDLDDEPTGGGYGLPLCGDCSRRRDDAADMEALDLADGALDGLFDG